MKSEAVSERQRIPLWHGFAFLGVIVVGTYLLFDLEALTEREKAFTARLEGAIAASLNAKVEDFFPRAGRMPEKFQMGGSPPAIYKLKVTTGRPGRRLTFDLSIQSTPTKAQRKFATRWKHELRSHRLGRLDPVELSRLSPSNHRLAHIRSTDGRISGLYFLAQRGRGLFGVLLKGITLDEFSDFERMIEPTLDIIANDGPTLMLDGAVGRNEQD